MKKLLFVFALIAIIIASCKKDKPSTPTTPAKYTISSSDVGDTTTNYLMAKDTTNLTSFSLGDPGEGKTWDFALAGTDAVDTMKFLGPSSTPAASSFPNSNLVMKPEPGQEIYSYLNKSTSNLEMIGFYADQQGLIMNANYTDNQIIMKFPSYFGTSFTDTGAVDAISYFSTYFTWVKLEMRSNFSSQIDASGKITTPTGTFDCIRDKRTEIQNSKMYTGPSQTGPWTQFGNPTIDTTYLYNFYSKGKGFSVAEIKVKDFTSSTITEIKYLK